MSTALSKGDWLAIAFFKLNLLVYFPLRLQFIFADFITTANLLQVSYFLSNGKTGTLILDSTTSQQISLPSKPSQWHC